MLNEERIILMTRTAAYEESEGKKNMIIAGYFRSDYIELNLMKSLFYSTVAFILVAAMAIYYQFEVLLQDIYKMDLLLYKDSILFVVVVEFLSQFNLFSIIPKRTHQVTLHFIPEQDCGHVEDNIFYILDCRYARKWIVGDNSLN